MSSVSSASLSKLPRRFHDTSRYFPRRNDATFIEYWLNLHIVQIRNVRTVPSIFSLHYIQSSILLAHSSQATTWEQRIHNAAVTETSAFHRLCLWPSGHADATSLKMFKQRDMLGLELRLALGISVRSRTRVRVNIQVILAWGYV